MEMRIGGGRMNAIKSKRGRPADEELWQRRRREILDVAATLFARHGYDETDTQALADQVGVGKGTVYRYFPSKRELFLASADRAMTRLQECLEGAIAAHEDPLVQIAVAIETFLGFFDEHPDLAEILILERALFRDRKKPSYLEHRERNFERWQRLFEGLITAGRVRDIGGEKIPTMISDLVYGTMFTNHLSGRPKSLREQAADIVDLLFLGLLTDRERNERLNQR
jgi:AcrR family transcriptional regulator